MIPKAINNFRIWCNSNGGWLTFIFGITALSIAVITNDKIKFGDATSFLSKIFAFLEYKIQLPLYVFLMIALLTIIYFNRIRNRYKKRKINFSFLVGIWLNEWKKNEPDGGSETIEIKEDGSYIRNNEHIFAIENFNFDYKTNQISFIKVAQVPPDTRRCINILNIENNDLLIGKENGYNIRYTRIS
jgi:hypothetical protein